MQRNSQSILENQIIAQEKIKTELSLGRISGPYSKPPFVNFKCSPLALRQKKNSNKYRLLHNLSAPYDWRSVNSNIPEEASKVKYSTIRDAVDIINEKRAIYLAKTDIADAFRLIPLHESQYNLTGFYCNGYYYDRCLPMGCSSSCKIFERFSDSLLWIMKSIHKIDNIVKVLDDFLFLSETYEACLRSLNLFKEICNYIGVPLAEHKTVGPIRCLEFLGIELDTTLMEARLPKEKLKLYSTEISSLLLKHKCTLREMKSILGKLEFSTAVVKGGRCFLRRLHDTTFGLNNPNRLITLESPAKLDLKTWLAFLNSYNGITILAPLAAHSSETLHLYTDSSKKGFAGTFKNHYIQGIFPESWSNYDIQFLEMFPIYLLIKLFSIDIKNTCVVFHSDNFSVVTAINRQTSRNQLIMRLLRPMILQFLTNNINFSAIHIPGKKNILCDKLSRFQDATGTLLANNMELLPTPIPQRLRPHNFKMTAEDCF